MALSKTCALTPCAFASPRSAFTQAGKSAAAVPGATPNSVRYRKICVTVSFIPVPGDRIAEGSLSQDIRAAGGAFFSFEALKTLFFHPNGPQTRHFRGYSLTP